MYKLLIEESLIEIKSVTRRFLNRRECTMSWIVVVLMLCGTNVFTACSEDDESEANHKPAYTTLKEALVGIDQISFIKQDPDPYTMKKKEKGLLDYKEQYSMLFRQDLDHEHTGGDTFQQRVAILFRGFDRPTIMLTEGYSWHGFGDGEDLGINLNANVIHVEHRNFGKSISQDQGRWQYETCAQASADLHAIYQVLKPIFSGKWMCSGTSKSGETAMDYAYFYPEDMNLAVAFCSPFCTSLFDNRFGPYLFNEVSTEDNREIMRNGISMGLKNGEDGIYRSLCEKMESSNQKKPSFTEYVLELFGIFFEVFQYTPRDMQESELLAIIVDETSLRDRIYDSIISGRDENMYTYYIDSVKEQIYVDVGFHYFANELAGTSFNINDYFRNILKPEDHWLIDTYDNRVRLDQIQNFFTNSTCPLLLVYSHDDPYSAAQPEKTGPNVKKIINPIGIHGCALNNTYLCPEAIKQEVMDYVCRYLGD